MAGEDPLTNVLQQPPSRPRNKTEADIAIEAEQAKRQPLAVIPPKQAQAPRPEVKTTRPPRLVPFDEFTAKWFSSSSEAQVAFMRMFTKEKITQHYLEVIYPAYVAAVKTGWKWYGD